MVIIWLIAFEIFTVLAREGYATLLLDQGYVDLSGLS